MAELFAKLLPILLVDVINPVLFGTLVYCAGSKRPVANGMSLLAGHTAAYLAGGLVIALGVEQVAVRLENPEPVDYVISGIIGAALVVAAIPMKKKGPPQANEPEWELTPQKCFGFGAIVNFVGLPFALPYFAAVDAIVSADLPTSESLVVLVAYNLAYALPFLLVPTATAFLGDSIKPLLKKINDVLDRIASVLVPVMLLLIGLALIADTAAFFYRGSGLL